MTTHSELILKFYYESVWVNGSCFGFKQNASKHVARETNIRNEIKEPACMKIYRN